MAGCPARDRAGVGCDDRIISEKLIQLVSNDLGLHRYVHSRAALLHQLAPSPHSGLSLLEEGAILVMIEAGEQARQDALRAADKADFDRIAQPNALSFDIDLHRVSLAGLWVILDIRVARSDDEERIASFQSVLRGRRAEKPGAARRVRAVIWQRRLAEERLDHGRAEPLRCGGQLVPSAQRTTARQNTDSSPLVEDRSRAGKLVLARLMGALGHVVRDVVGDVPLRALIRLQWE